MSKEIYLYSKDKKYKCAVELSDILDYLGCPDHSMIILTEKRPNGTYVIAQARDRLLETEKDQQIVDLQHQLEVAEKALELAMEEKERYVNLCDRQIKDTQNQSQYFMGIEQVCKLLNQQDKRIKELEVLLNADKKMETNSIKGFEKLKQENQQLKEQISLKMEELHIAYCGIEDVKTKNGNLKAEIKQLKQSQKQLAIEGLKKLRQNFSYCPYSDDKVYEDKVCEIIDDQIKELKGEE